jgi:amphi-Trp domain-containing protein
MKNTNVDVEKSYSPMATAAKLRRIADALEGGKRFEIKIGGNRVYVPSDARIEVEYERNGDEEGIEIELTWTRRELQR